MTVERITAGTFTAVVCRPTSPVAPGGCLVVYDGVDPASAVPCLFLTETTACQLADLLRQARRQIGPSRPNPARDAQQLKHVRAQLRPPCAGVQETHDAHRRVRGFLTNSVVHER